VRIQREFLQFLEPYLSDNKADPEHYEHASFNNYLLRVPGSFNSKTHTQVKVVQKWNGVRPDTKYLYGDFLAYLVDKRKEERKIECDGPRFSKRCSGQTSTVTSIIDWIEKLLNRPLGDFRKYCIWRIFTPYLINIKKLSYDDAFNVLKDWLKECDKITPLDFNANDRIKTNLRAAIRVGYLPVSFNKLELEKKELYHLISKGLRRN
jgi:Primase X